MLRHSMCVICVMCVMYERTPSAQSWHESRPVPPLALLAVPGGQAERIGPVPGQVAPRFVEVPVIWTLARLYPDLILIHHESAGSAVLP